MPDDSDIEWLDADDDGRAVIRLGTPVSSGYIWRLSDPGAGLLVEGHERKPGETFGGAAEESYRVRLTGDEPADIELRLERPWESEALEVRRYRIGRLARR